MGFYSGDIRKNIIRRIVLIFGVLFAFMLIMRAVGSNRFVAVMPLPENMKDVQDLQIVSDNDDILRIKGYSLDGNRLRIELEPGERGVAEIRIQDPDNQENVSVDYFRVGRTKTVYQESTGEFGGDRLLMFCALIFLASLAFMLLGNFRRAKGTALYSYGTLHSIGFGIFTLFAAVVLLISLIRLYATPDQYNMQSVFSSIRNAASAFMFYTSPFILLFAVLMTISNISLIRHEGRRVQNMLGILIGILMVGGFLLEFRMNMYVFGSELYVLVYETLNNVYCTVFVYFECILIGSILCGIRAARYIPKMDKDYILILGCKIFGNGKLTPLLRGRVDRAVSFAAEQERQTGKKAVFVPSGGQGPDEVIAEAEAMKNYLLEIGVEKDRILMENQSANTYENMKFSKKLIEDQKKNARVCFSTTNYHVFRSGLWAQLAGLNAEGMGSDTKWYFWPNAFMREVVGLLANHVKQELILLVLIVAFYTMLNVLLF